MKKTLALLLCLVLLFSLGACSGSGDAAKDKEASENKSVSGSNAPSPKSAGQAPDDNRSSAKNKALVVYFSCTGHTEAMAQEIAGQTGADLYEIVPDQPYTDEDISYQNDNSRANQEMNDDRARPAISGDIQNLTDYDTLYIGYPKMEYDFRCVSCI